MNEITNIKLSKYNELNNMVRKSFSSDKLFVVLAVHTAQIVRQLKTMSQ